MFPFAKLCHIEYFSSVFNLVNVVHGSNAVRKTKIDNDFAFSRESILMNICSEEAMTLASR